MNVAVVISSSLLFVTFSAAAAIEQLDDSTDGNDANPDSTGMPDSNPCNGVMFYTNYDCEVEADGDNRYIRSPGYPKPLNKLYTCEVTIDKNPYENVQLRLDFIVFDMPSPSNKSTLICDTDRLELTSGSTIGSFNDLTVCGPFSDQHLNYGLEDESDSVNIKFITSSSYYNRSWRIKLTKKRYTRENPPGCDQFYSRASGTILTINASQNGLLIKDMDRDFNICIRRQKNVCAIKYEPCELTDNPFNIIQPLLCGDNVTMIMLGPWIHYEIPKYIQSGCIRYRQQLCMDSI